MRGNDHLFDQMISCCDDFDLGSAPPRIPPTHWKTRDGRVLCIKEMEDEHLRNTVEMLRRKGIRHATFDSLELEAFRRGLIEPETSNAH